MKSFRMHYFYMAPLVALAIVACAKRDNDFAKRAAQARAAAQKPAAEPAKPATDAAKSVVDPTKPAANKDRGTSPSDDATPAESKDSADYSGDLDQIRKDSCQNPITMEPAEDESELVLSDLITKEKGSYILQATEMYVDRADKDSTVKNQVDATGSAFELPASFKAMAADNHKMVIVCHTLKLSDSSSQKLSENITLPYEISTLDGSITTLRQDKVELAQSTKKTTTTLYAQDYDLKKLLSEDGENKKVLIVKKTDSADITIKIQIKKTDEKTGSVSTITTSGTYVLKK